jgi:tetratricopeptide (TPR) repeat protein
MNNLAVVLQAQGDVTGARDLYQQVLDAQQRLLGPEHPSTLGTMNNLAALLFELGDLSHARNLFEQVLETRQRLLGPDHPSTRRVLANLRAVKQAQEESSS